LYDPNGGYLAPDGAGGRIPRAGGAVFDVPLRDYFAYWAKKEPGSQKGLRMQYIRTTPKEDKLMDDAALRMGNGPGFFGCASACSYVLGILKGVDDANATWPSTLADSIANNPRVVRDRMRNPDTDEWEDVEESEQGIERDDFCMAC